MQFQINWLWLTDYPIGVWSDCDVHYSETINFSKLENFDSIKEELKNSCKLIDINEHFGQQAIERFCHKKTPPHMGFEMLFNFKDSQYTVYFLHYSDDMSKFLEQLFSAMTTNIRFHPFGLPRICLLINDNSQDFKLKPSEELIASQI